MQTEIEAKFLRIDPDTIRERLQKAGATLKQPMMMMRRHIYDNEFTSQKNGFVRIRDEGYRVAMTYKQYEEMSLTGAREIEFTVSDYDAAVAFMEAIGITPKSVQEARREIWMLDEAEVVIDEWPWIDPFVEIEAATEKQVKAAAKKLGFDWDEAAFGDIMTAYRHQYPNTGDARGDMVYNLPSVRFEDAVPSILKV
jgi:adenylate cyclase, class 2